jgi:hypothetical protein
MMLQGFPKVSNIGRGLRARSDRTNPVFDVGNGLKLDWSGFRGLADDLWRGASLASQKNFDFRLKFEETCQANDPDLHEPAPRLMATAARS